MTIKILNLYAGIGGNRKLWAGDIHVTAVEFDPQIAEIYQEFYPNDNCIVGDAHEYLLNNYSEFDFIWASPPCPTHSRLCTSKSGWGIVDYPDMKLYQEVILLKHFFKGKYAVENVISYYTPLIEPEKICRHYFWVNFKIGYGVVEDKTQKMIGSKKTGNVKDFADILGFDVPEIRNGVNWLKALRNCVLPELGKHILDCAIGNMVKEEQMDLFS